MDRVFRIDSWSRRTAAPSYDMLMVRDCTYSRLYAGEEMLMLMTIYQ
jgi:hypothetical protein